MKTLTLTKEQIKKIFLENQGEVTQEEIDYIFDNYKQFIKDFPWRYKHFLEHKDFYYFFSDIEDRKRAKKLSPSELKKFNYKAFVEFNFTDVGYNEINDPLLRDMFGTKDGYVDLNKLKKITPIQKRMIVDIYEINHYLKEEYDKFLETYGKFDIKKLTIEINLESVVEQIQKRLELPSINCVSATEVIKELRELNYRQYVNIKYKSKEFKVYQEEEED